MKIRRFVTAETRSGVAVQMTELLETTAPDLLPTDIWGFDQLPNLPLAAEQVLGEYQQKGLFGPKGALRVVVWTLPPETGNRRPDLGPLLAKLDLGTGHNMTPGKSGGGMHRSDSIDLVFVISGEGELAYPDEDGELKQIHLKPGDFIVQNGNFHEWRNRSTAHFVVFIVTLGAERKAAP
ncbi:MAG TPA: cupin domain-containing protein [Rhizomicrobium sp.]|nr:cupin domain-containing protein [Rhizomicrobium sp.]